MPSQIKTKQMQELILAYKRKMKILKKHYQDEVDFLDLSEHQQTSYLVEDTAVLKILEEVAKQRTTQIKVQQIKMF